MLKIACKGIDKILKCKYFLRNIRALHMVAEEILRQTLVEQYPSFFKIVQQSYG